MDSTSCGCLSLMSWKGIIKPQSRSHKSLQKEEIFCFTIFATYHIFATVRLNTDASSTEMANTKTKQSKAKP